MKIDIKKYLLEEGIVDHLKNNYGKYIVGGAAGALGATYAAGQGYLGVDAQDSVQDYIGDVSQNLKNEARYHDLNSTIDSIKDVTYKPDNIINPENYDNYKEMLTTQKMINPETWEGKSKLLLSKGLSKLGNIEGPPETTNFTIRNPIVSSGQAIDNIRANVNPILGLSYK